MCIKNQTQSSVHVTFQTTMHKKSKEIFSKLPKMGSSRQVAAAILKAASRSYTVNDNFIGCKFGDNMALVDWFQNGFQKMYCLRQTVILANNVFMF